MIVQKELFGESKHIEFKEEIPKKHDKFLKDIIAFANTSGGKTIVGIVDDTGEVVGLGDQNPFKLSDAISNMISDACTPQINMEITPKTIDGKTVLEIEVFHGKYCPYYLASVGKEKSSYIRVNGTSRPADVRTLKELELMGQQVSYDTLREIGEKYNQNAAKKLMDEMYRKALAGKSKCRNKAIAEAFQYMKIIEGWGTGLPRLFRQCRERGLVEPRFEELGDGIKVTVYRKPGSEQANGITQSTTQTTQLPDERKMSDVEIRIVDAMKENSKITQSQLANLLGMDINAVKYYVRRLSNDNIIEHKGSNRSGEWEVLITDYAKWRNNALIL